MKYCFCLLTAAANMRIVHYMEAEHRYQQGFYALAHIVRMCYAIWRLIFNSQFISSMGKLPVLPHLTQLSRKAYGCCHKPLGIVTR